MNQAIIQGKEMLENGAFERAKSHFEGLLDKKGLESQAHLWLARLDLMSGDLDGTRAHLKAAEAIEPKDAEARAIEAVYHLQLNQFEAALELLESARASAPGLAMIYPNLSVCLRELGRVPEAIEAGRKAVELGPQDPAAHFALSQALAVDGQIEESIREAVQTLGLNPRHLMAYVFLGAIHRAAGAIDAVLALYEEALRNLPAATPLREDLVELLLRQGQRDRALEHARILLEQRGEMDDHLRFAQCAERLDQDQLAQEALVRAAGLDPKDWRPHLLLGELYAKMGLGAQAVEAYSAAVERDGENWEAHNGLGITRVRLGAVQEGLPSLEAAHELAPERVEPRLNLALAHAALKHLDQARSQAEDVLQATEPGSYNHEEARRLLGSLARETPDLQVDSGLGF